MKEDKVIPTLIVNKDKDGNVTKVTDEEGKELPSYEFKIEDAEKRKPDLFSRISYLRRAYYFKYALMPTTLYVGHNEYNELTNSVYFIVEAFDNIPFTQEENLHNKKPKTCFGMDIKRVMEDNYLNVGEEIC